MESIIFPMNGYILTTKKTMYAIHDKNRTKLLCFKDKRNANVCRLNIAKYKYRFGKWPSRILEESNIEESKEEWKWTIPKNERIKLREIYNELEIDKVQTKDMEQFCILNDMSLLLCNRYIINNNKVKIDGFEIENTEIDYNAQINKFNYIYTNSRII